MKFFKLAMLGGLVSSVMLAGTVQPCTEQPLSAYVGGANCSIGNLVFGGFTYESTALGTGMSVPASAITVVPLTTPGNLGIQFEANWTGGGAGGSDSAIGYFVATGSGAPTLDAASLSLVAEASGVANAVLDEYLCPGGAFSSTCANQVHLDESVGLGGEPPNLSGTFAPVSIVGLVKDIRVYGVTGTSSASVIANNYSTTTSPVPEPVTPVLCLSGLLLLWRFRKNHTA
jgi:hypothetical protein